jgi:hypothetical protein
VAKSTHAGIPWLRYIRERLGKRVHFWPFDGWDIPAGPSAVVEVYPALWSRSFAHLPVPCLVERCVVVMLCHHGRMSCTTAGFALGALRRLEQLIQEAVVTVPRALIAETINVIAVLAGRGAQRRLIELAAVEGLDKRGDYRLVTPAKLVSLGDPA